MRKILIVDDEKHIVQMLDINVRAHGYVSLCVYDGEAALRAAREEHPDVILLDIMMPGMDGIEVCRRLKADPETRSVPVIMVSAKTEQSDRIAGLRGGADDYVTKPFNLEELFLRIRAALRQVDLLKEEKGTLLGQGSVLLDTQRYQVTTDGNRIDLTLTEFRILYLLLRSRGEEVSRKELVQELFDKEPWEVGRTTDVHIRNLRKKLEDAGARGCTIETIRGIGYRIGT